MSPGSRDDAARHEAHVQSLARGLAVIESFDADHPSMTLSEVARRTGLTRAAARRFLLTLVDLGHVRTDGRLFTLTPQVLRLGHAYLSGLGLPRIARPHLEALSRNLGESTSVAVLDGGSIVYVERIEARRIMQAGISVGTRFAAHATSMGRVLLAASTQQEVADQLDQFGIVAYTRHTLTNRAQLLAQIDQVRQQGYSLVDGELEPGLRSIAVPLMDAAGIPTAAVNVSTTTNVTKQEMISVYLPALRRTAQAIHQDLCAMSGRRPVGQQGPDTEESPR